MIDLARRPVLITSAAGFRGTGVVERLRGEGLVLERHDHPEPMSLGADFEIRIRDLAQVHARLAAFEGRRAWHTFLPDGEPRRRLDTSRAVPHFGFHARALLEKGLRRTIEWYRSTR